MSKLDYSSVMETQVTIEGDTWEPPVHKYFGRKLPNGKMEPEPRYTHQEYPKMKYADVNGSIRVKQVGSVQEEAKLGEEWVDNPAKFGYIGAPSFEQMLEMREVEKADDEVLAPARRGRPAKDQKE